MAFRRSTKRFTRRPFKRRRSMGTRTRGPVKEPLWRVANFGFAQQRLLEDPGQIDVLEFLVMNPKLMIEQLSGAEQAQIQNMLQAPKGVHVGGIVWRTIMVVQSPSTPGVSYVSAHARVQELLLTRWVGEDGLPTAFPDFETTWRPISVSGLVTVPHDNEGDLIRIHHRKLGLLPNGSNLHGFDGGEDIFGGEVATAGTQLDPTWGTNSLRLKKLITDDQQLVLHYSIAVGSNVEPAQPTVVAIHSYGHIYYRIAW